MNKLSVPNLFCSIETCQSCGPSASLKWWDDTTNPELPATKCMARHVKYSQTCVNHRRIRPLHVKICSTMLKQLLSKISISQTLKRQYDRWALIIFTVAWSFPPYIPNTYSVISSESVWNLFSVNIQSPQRKKHRFWTPSWSFLHQTKYSTF